MVRLSCYSHCNDVTIGKIFPNWMFEEGGHEFQEMIFAWSMAHTHRGTTPSLLLLDPKYPKIYLKSGFWNQKICITYSQFTKILDLHPSHIHFLYLFKLTFIEEKQIVTHINHKHLTQKIRWRNLSS